MGVNVQPPSSVFKTIQDKLVQKDHFARNGVALPRYMDTPDVESVRKAAEKFGLPLMLKSRKEGYDGRGNCVLKVRGGREGRGGRREQTNERHQNYFRGDGSE